MKKILFVTICLFILFAGCTSENKDDNNPPVTQYQNFEYIEWELDSIGILQIYTDYIIDALDTYDYDSMSYWAEKQNEKIEKQLDEADDFVLTADYDRIRDEYIEYLEDLKMANYYIVKASDSIELGDYDGAITYLDYAIDYIERATAHLHRCTELIEQLT